MSCHRSGNSRQTALSSLCVSLRMCVCVCVCVCEVWTSSVFLRLLMRVLRSNLLPDVSVVCVCVCVCVCVFVPEKHTPLHAAHVVLCYSKCERHRRKKQNIQFLSEWVFSCDFIKRVCVCVSVCVCASNVTAVPNWGSFDLNLTEQQRLNQPDKKMSSGNFWGGCWESTRVQSVCVCVCACVRVCVCWLIEWVGGGGTGY